MDHLMKNEFCLNELQCPKIIETLIITTMELNLILKLEKAPEFGLPVTTKHNKQWQRLNLYGHFIQMAGNLRRWRVHTLTDHLVFSFQGKVFIAGNKQGGWGVLKFREDQVEETATFLSWRLAVPRDGWSSVPLWNTMAWMPPLVPRQCPRRSAVSPGARVGLICSFSNRSFNIYITC